MKPDAKHCLKLSIRCFANKAMGMGFIRNSLIFEELHVTGAHVSVESLGKAAEIRNHLQRT